MSAPATSPADTRSAAPAGWRSLARPTLHVVASLLMHGAIVAVVIFSGFTLGEARPGGFSKTEVQITLPSPPATPTRQDATAERKYVAPAARLAEAPPQLLGLTTPAVGAAPVLRSSAAAVGDAVESADLLKRDDGTGLGATFAGLGANRAANVVYVVDASGAMVTSLRFVLEELNRSVSRLSTGQKFAVVLFRERSDPRNPPVEVFSPSGADPGRTMFPATPANKAELRKWLSGIRPLGRSNPLEGLRRAMVFQADAVFLLSRSIRRTGGTGPDASVWGRGTAEILAELDRLNPRDAKGQRRVVIKCIQFIDEDPSGTMPAIGNEHGDGPGSYTVLSSEALTKQ